MARIELNTREQLLNATRLPEKKLNRLIEVRKEIAETDLDRTNGLMFLAARLVMTTLPHSETDKRIMVRQNGKLTLTITAMNDKYRLPYGIFPRLIMIWICTEAVKKKSRKIEFGDSFAEFLRRLGAVNAGKRGSKYQMEAVKDQLRRLLSLGVHMGEEGDGCEETASFTIASTSKTWGDHDAVTDVLTLNDDFYNQITRSPVPFDRRAVVALKNSSMDLDVLMWASYRVKKITFDTKTRPMSFPSLEKHFGSNFKRPIDFKRNFLASLARVKVIWSDLDYEVLGNSLVLKKSRPLVPTLIRTAKKSNKSKGNPEPVSTTSKAAETEADPLDWNEFCLDPDIESSPELPARPLGRAFVGEYNDPFE